MNLEAALKGKRRIGRVVQSRLAALLQPLELFRASRLNEQWRVIYRVVADVLLVQVVRVTPHDYRRS